jgi:hypothetical protein
MLGGEVKGMAIPVNNVVQEGPMWGNFSKVGHTT